jgi:hypothetical protein
MTIADWNFVEQSGQAITKVGTYSKFNLEQLAKGSPTDPQPGDGVLFKSKIEGLSTSLVQELKMTSGDNSADSFIESFSSSDTATQSSDFGVMYSSDDPLTDTLDSTAKDKLRQTYQWNAVHNPGATTTLKTKGGDEQKRQVERKPFSYDAASLRQALISDPGYGSKVKIVLDQMDQKGQKFVVEDLNLRNFDGTNKGAYVDSEAADMATAKEWALDALREWAGDHASLDNPDADHLFAEIARSFAKTFDQDSALSLGQTLDFLYLFSKEASGHGNGEMYTAVDATGSPNLPQIYLWAFSNKTSVISPEKTEAMVNIPAHLGMHQDWWESDRTGQHPAAGKDAATGTWPDDDQTHHFAAYFALGAGYSGAGNMDIPLVTALKHTNDYPGPPGPKAANPGDYYLGILGADVGKLWRSNPGYVGDYIADLLKHDWKYAFNTTGRGITGLP